MVLENIIILYQIVYNYWQFSLSPNTYTKLLNSSLHLVAPVRNSVTLPLLDERLITKIEKKR